MKKNPKKVSGQWSTVNGQLSIVSCSSRGFSLIELVFAMSFLTLIVMGVVNLQSGNLSMISSQNNQIQAGFLANQGVSVVRAIGYTAINAAYGEHSGTPCRLILALDPNQKIYGLSQSCLDSALPEKIAPELFFERFIEVEKPAGFIDACKVTVFVEWDDSAGSHRRKEGEETVNAHAEAKTIVFNP